MNREKMQAAGNGLWKLNIKGISKDEWLKIRKVTVGGSEVGALLGMNPWQSPYSLYCDKLDMTPPFEGNLATEVGTWLEDFVARRFADQSGLDVQKTNYIWYNDQYEGLHASPDRFVFPKGKRKAPIAGLECKTTSAFNTKKFKGGDFPLQYYAQCVQYMAVTGIDQWFLAVLVGNSEFHIYQLTRVPREKPEWCEAQVVVDDNEIKVLYAAAQDFLYKVANHIAPEADGSEATTKVIGQLAGKSNDTEVDLSRHELLIDQYMELGEQIDKLEEQRNAIANIIKLDMGDSGSARCFNYTISYKTQVSHKVDTTRLKKELPDVAARYMRESVSRPFSIKEKR